MQVRMCTNTQTQDISNAISTIILEHPDKQSKKYFMKISLQSTSRPNRTVCVKKTTSTIRYFCLLVCLLGRFDPKVKYFLELHLSVVLPSCWRSGRCEQDQRSIDFAGLQTGRGSGSDCAVYMRGAQDRICIHVTLLSFLETTHPSDVFVDHQNS